MKSDSRVESSIEISSSPSDAQLELEQPAALDSSCSFNPIANAFDWKSDLFEDDNTSVLSFLGSNGRRSGLSQILLRTRILDFGFSKSGLELLRSPEEV